MEHQQQHEAEENHERWLVSYADYVTLLFAFFVVMFASSHADKQKAAQFSESVKRAYGAERRGSGRPTGTAVPPAESAKPAPPPPASASELALPLAELVKRLDGEIHSGKVRIRMETRGLVISLQETAFFRPGDDQVLPDMHGAIGKIVDAIRHLPNRVRLEGHSDSVPIRTARFPSNWHLSTARALSMFQFMTSKCDMPAGQLVVAGCADTDPVDSNDTPEGRARNRRVDVVVLSYTAIADLPAARGAAPPASSPNREPAHTGGGAPAGAHGTR